MGWKSKLVSILTAGALTISSGEVLARKWLGIKYELHKSKASRQQEVALKVPIRRNVSYALLARMYTGSERNATQILVFNDYQKLVFNPKKPMFIYIPKDLLRSSLLKVLDENDFSTFEIESEEDEINSLWEIATDFMNERLGVEERIDLLLILNDEINPTNPVVYPEQNIIVPESLVDKNKMDKDDARPVQTKKVEGKKEVNEKQPIPEKKPETPAVIPKGKQNPFRIDGHIIQRKLIPKDLFGSRRIRSLGHGRYRISVHRGMDLAAPLGSSVYPVEGGVIIYAGKERNKKLWRNGIVVEYKTTSGIVVKYCHLKRVANGLWPGKPISLLSVLGSVGFSGNASKSYPHLHVGVKVGGKVVNPMPYVVR